MEWACMIEQSGVLHAGLCFRAPCKYIYIYIYIYVDNVLTHLSADSVTHSYCWWPVAIQTHQMQWRHAVVHLSSSYVPMWLCEGQAHLHNLSIRGWWGTESNAFLISNKMAPISLPWSSVFAKRNRPVVGCFIVVWWFRNWHYRTVSPKFWGLARENGYNGHCGKRWCYAVSSTF